MRRMKRLKIDGYDVYALLFFTVYLIASAQGTWIFPLVGLGALFLGLALGKGAAWLIRWAKGPPNQARFLVMEKQSLQPTDQVLGISPSFISPPFWIAGRPYQVRLRFAPSREAGPDSNDLILACPPELYAVLREGMHGVGVWEKNRLLEFTPEEARS